MKTVDLGFVLNEYQFIRINNTATVRRLFVVFCLV